MKKFLIIILLLITIFISGCNKTTTTITTKKRSDASASFTSSTTKTIKSSTTKPSSITTKKVTTRPITTKNYLSNIEYDEYDNYYFAENISYGEDVKNVFDIYFPKYFEHINEVDVVLFLHGGVWIFPGKEQYYDFTDSFAEELFENDTNTVLITMNYRLGKAALNGNTIENMIEDISLSINKIKDLFDEMGINVRTLNIGGHSAGGHLALLYSYKYSKDCPLNLNSCYSLSGPTDIVLEDYKEAIKKYSSMLNVDNLMMCLTGTDNIVDAKEELPNISPINYVNNNSIKTIIVHGNIDPTVPYSNSLDLYIKLKEYNIGCDFINDDSWNHNNTREYRKLKNAGFFDTLIDYLD